LAELSDPIDFGRLAAALLNGADHYVPQWLDDGHREGHEWKARNPMRNDKRIGSFSVNLTTGAWADFADMDAKGGDLISLYAYLNGLNNGQAARQLMRVLGWARPQDEAVQTPARAASVGADGRPEPPPDDAGPRKPKKESKWRAIVPVPKHAPAPTFRFGYKDEKRGGQWVELDATQTWAYEFEGQLYGYVSRFERVASDGVLVKDTVPRTWCQDESDERGLQRWHWKTWETPRPLYVPATVLSGTPADVPVVIVEGEKCALAGHQLLGHEFDFVSWPGGAKAWAKASWGWLMGRTVYLWPDCDAKRATLRPAERESGMDPASKPMLAEMKQPGMAAMVNIGSLLVADHGCTVHLCAIPQPGEVADGWDIADAIAQGWDAARVREFIRGARTFVPPDDAARAKAAGASTPTFAGAAQGAGADDDDAPDLRWRARLLTSTKGATLAVRDNLVIALDGVPAEGIAGIADARGVIAFNEFTNDVMKMRDTPWGTPAGVWDEVDELEMGNWLTMKYWLPSMPRGTLEEAVLMVAKRHRYHPVRARVEALRGTWDQDKRLSTWLRRACMEEDEIDEPTQEYLARVGTWLVMAMCARVLPEAKEGTRTVRGPGTKFDFMTIFEGAQGAKKSTLASVLGWGHSADTGLVLGEKDSYQNLQGIWVYEWGELDSLNRSEVTRVKNFVSSPKDRFRASFDRRAKDYPRQVVFIGTTNEDHYLTDPTGNRRFWPVAVTREIDVAWVTANLEQMFAEALVYLDAGQRFWPTSKEQRELFDPQQLQRTVENAIEAEFMRYLYDETQRVVGLGHENGTLVDKIGLTELLKRIGYPVEKQTAVVIKAAGSALKRMGWLVQRSSKAGRQREYCRPSTLPAQLKAGGSKESSKAPKQGESPERASDDPPF
jgi:predicted P-loop ATPase